VTTAAIVKRLAPLTKTQSKSAKNDLPPLGGVGAATPPRHHGGPHYRLEIGFGGAVVGKHVSEPRCALWSRLSTRSLRSCGR
jgi:hypothetical protein